MDYIANTNGDMILCHHTNTPCSPMCPFYIEQPARYAICEDVDNSFVIQPNSTLRHPWPSPEFPKWRGRQQLCINPNKA